MKSVRKLVGPRSLVISRTAAGFKRKSFRVHSFLQQHASEVVARRRRLEVPGSERSLASSSNRRPRTRASSSSLWLARASIKLLISACVLRSRGPSRAFKGGGGIARVGDRFLDMAQGQEGIPDSTERVGCLGVSRPSRDFA